MHTFFQADCGRPLVVWFLCLRVSGLLVAAAAAAAGLLTSLLAREPVILYHVNTLYSPPLTHWKPSISFSAGNKRHWLNLSLTLMKCKDLVTGRFWRLSDEMHTYIKACQWWCGIKCCLGVILCVPACIWTVSVCFQTVMKLCHAVKQIVDTQYQTQRTLSLLIWWIKHRVLSTVRVLIAAYGSTGMSKLRVI